MSVPPATSGAIGRRALAFCRSHIAAGYGMIGRMWVVMTGPITILVLAHHFTPVLQGYFFTFLSLATVRTMAELGLGQVIIVQMTRLQGDVAYSGHVPPKVAGLIRFAVKWFVGAGCVAGVILCFVGTWLFSARSGLPQEEWLLPWVATSVLIAADIALSGLMFPLEGAGLVRPVYFCRMMRSIVNSAILWVCIFMGLKLWCVSIALAAGLLWTTMFIMSRNGHLVRRALNSQCRAASIAWHRELFPSQWRIALSSVAEFATFYTLTPFAYVAYGPIVAGQIGVTWQLAAAVSAIAGALAATSFPQFSRLASSRSIVQLDRLMAVTSAASLILCLLGVLAVGGIVWVLELEGYQIATRLLPFSDVAILLSGVLIWHVNLSTVFYLRAHGGDPYLPVTLGGAALMVSSEFTLGRWWGPQGLIWGYVVVGACFMVPAGVYLLHRKRAAFGYPAFTLADVAQPLMTGAASFVRRSSIFRGRRSD